MATKAETTDGRKLNSRSMTDAAWLALAMQVRSGAVTLICGNCLVPMLTRNRSIDGRQRHFYHLSDPGSCTNVEHESESAHHHGLKGVLADAFAAVKGVQVVEEYRAEDPDGEQIRVDVAALRDLTPATFAEVQTSYEPLEELVRRDTQRRRAINAGGLSRDGWARTTPWFTPRAHDGIYGQFPYLYLSQDGQRITDGIYPVKAGQWQPEESPVEFDIDEAAACLLAGSLVQVGWGWADRRGVGGKVKAGRRRRQLQQSPLAERLCEREPSVVAETLAPSPASRTPGPARSYEMGPLGKPFMAHRHFLSDPATCPTCNGALLRGDQ
jgi:hypothetical protein